MEESVYQGKWLLIECLSSQPRCSPWHRWNLTNRQGRAAKNATLLRIACIHSKGDRVECLVKRGEFNGIAQAIDPWIMLVSAILRC